MKREHSKIPFVLHRAGDNLEIGGAKLAVLAPPRDAEAHPSRPNDESLVIKISYGATSALLEGDAEKKTEKQVVEENPKADLLKGRASWKLDLDHPRTAGRGSSTIRRHLSRHAQCLRASPAGSTGSAGGSARFYLPDRYGRGSHFLP